VLVLDLNGFKQVNDRFGQIEGNNLLRTFATALKESCASTIMRPELAVMNS